jgi:hypothetical protein
MFDIDHLRQLRDHLHPQHHHQRLRVPGRLLQTNLPLGHLQGLLHELRHLHLQDGLPDLCGQLRIEPDSTDLCLQALLLAERGHLFALPQRLQLLFQLLDLSHLHHRLLIQPTGQPLLLRDRQVQERGQHVRQLRHWLPDLPDQCQQLQQLPHRIRAVRQQLRLPARLLPAGRGHLLLALPGPVPDLRHQQLQLCDLRLGLLQPRDLLPLREWVQGLQHQQQLPGLQGLLHTEQQRLHLRGWLLRDHLMHGLPFQLPGLLGGQPLHCLHGPVRGDQPCRPVPVRQ